MDEKNDDMAMRDYFSMSGGGVNMSNEPAYPTGLIGKIKFTHNGGNTAHVSEYESKFTGMTIRDYFAGQVINAAYKDFTEACRTGKHEGRAYENWAASISQDAYKVADAMLRAREEQ